VNADDIDIGARLDELLARHPLGRNSVPLWSLHSA
jgi:hypothetical protein